MVRSASGLTITRQRAVETPLSGFLCRVIFILYRINNIVQIQGHEYGSNRRKENPHEEEKIILKIQSTSSIHWKKSFTHCQSN